MKCPICKSCDLHESTMNNGLKGYTCNKCEGTWVRYPDYEVWNKGRVSESEGDYREYLPEYDHKKAALCPDCGVILIKYKVSKDIPFYLDHCGTCNGVWLDKAEWDNLIKNKLHHHMNSFFTQPWQKRIRLEMTGKRFDQQYLDKFGEEDYQKVKDIREWLKEHPKKYELIQFIMDEDPYKI